MTIYAAYGSNLNHKQMAIRCPNAKFIGNGTLKNYRLVFRGVADIEWDRNSEVLVGLWDVTPECIKALDQYEGYPNMYKRGTVDVITRPQSVEAFAYYMDITGSYREPAMSYLKSIVAGYAHCDLPFEALANSLKKNKKLYLNQETV